MELNKMMVNPNLQYSFAGYEDKGSNYKGTPNMCGPLSVSESLKTVHRNVTPKEIVELCVTECEDKKCGMSAGKQMPNCCLLMISNKFNVVIVQWDIKTCTQKGTIHPESSTDTIHIGHTGSPDADNKPGSGHYVQAFANETSGFQKLVLSHSVDEETLLEIAKIESLVEDEKRDLFLENSPVNYSMIQSPNVVEATPETWSCIHCTFDNNDDLSYCEMCDKSRSKKQLKPTRVTASNSVKPPPGFWECASCTLHNCDLMPYCSTCMTPRYPQ